LHALPGRREPANVERMRKLSCGSSRFGAPQRGLDCRAVLSVLAEETWHHPELVSGWGFCEVCLATRKIEGPHESDFVMAARIDALAAAPLDSAWLPPLPARRWVPGSTKG
jgi:pterin-4a-carbinolamine dehydratase